MQDHSGGNVTIQRRLRKPGGEQKRAVIDQPSRCSLLILPFESRFYRIRRLNGNERRDDKRVPKKGKRGMIGRRGPNKVTRTKEYHQRKWR